MFGLGPWEIAVIVGALLLIAGPTLLPKLGRYVGKTLTGLRESAESFSENLREEMKAEPAEPPILAPPVASEERTEEERNLAGC
jgi:Sec-independent protein translocase protein TatA